LLNERFVEGKKTGEEADRPCILLIDELDLLVTRNQSVTNKSCCKKLVIRCPRYLLYETRLAITFLLSQVLYNILDWPTKPHSKLIVIGKI
jgi:origin recognition complex subunit 1